VVNEDPGAGGTNLPQCTDLALLNFGNGFVLDNIQNVIYYRAQADFLVGSSINGSRIRMDVRGEGPNESLFNELEVRLRNVPVQGDSTVVTPLGSFIVNVVNVGETVVVIPDAAVGTPLDIPP